jgi:hypothetical protein
MALAARGNLLSETGKRMNLETLVTMLKLFDAVLVTGPQRSGTAIATKILAHELGYREIAEEAFRIHDHNAAYEIMKEGKVVLHAPGLCHVADLFTYKLRYAVVMMRRPIEDIHNSEKRVHWRTAYDGANLKAEQIKYADRFGIYGDNIALIKYYCFDTQQKQTCVSFDLKYDDLRGHPMWKEERMEFTARQTE